MATTTTTITRMVKLLGRGLLVVVSFVVAVGAQESEKCAGRARIGGSSQGGAAGRMCGGRGTGGDRRDRPAGLIPVPLTQTRSIDGSGEDSRGRAGAELLRMTPASYPDGVGNGMMEEPSARLISNLVASTDGIVGSSMDDEGQQPISDMIWIWGQFLDHDIDLTEGAAESFVIMSPDCENDIVCLIPFTRSEFIYTMADGDGDGDGDGIGDDTTTRSHINRITSFIDASMVYGSDKERADALREFRHGLLKVQDGNMLPYNDVGMDNAALEDDGTSSRDPTKLFLAGDVRANEQIGLTAMHTLFVREHNRLAKLLRVTFPYSDDEKLYQMARKIVGAEIQRITYNEFLPILIGPTYASECSLETYTGYDPEVNPAIATEFSTVAFRVGHTMLSPTLLMMHEEEPDNMSLIDAFFNPNIIMGDTKNMDILLAGFCHQNAQPVDPVVVDEVRNFLFGHPDSGIGHDLASLNIQRGRDHGIPNYNDLRVGLGLAAAMTFADISSNAAVQQALSEAYGGDIGLVDAWVGGLAEAHVPGGMVGELFATIIRDQFTRLMYGDPFFFLRDGDLKDTILIDRVIDVSKVMLSDILAANTDLSDFGLQEGENVFLTNSP